MADAIIKEIESIQADICVIEGMAGAVLENAYGGTRTEYIGNSLAEELGTAYRKQGFAEGMMAAAGMVCGEEGMYG